MGVVVVLMVAILDVVVTAGVEAAELIAVVVVAPKVEVNVGASVVVADAVAGMLVETVMAGVVLVISSFSLSLSFLEISWQVFSAFLLIMVAVCSLSGEVLDLLSVSLATMLSKHFEAALTAAVAVVAETAEISLCSSLDMVVPSVG